MLASGVIGLMGVLTIWIVNQTSSVSEPFSAPVNYRLAKLWRVAKEGMNEKKYLRAEKALLTILKLDKTNAAAYNRLGILYSRQKEFKDAIECFEIASSIQPSASSLHNLGLIYFETENYEKSATAFEGALKLEDTLAARHIAYAKALDKLGHDGDMIEALKKAVELENNPQTIKLLIRAYEKVGNEEEASNLRKKAKRAISTSKPKRVVRPRRVTF